MTLRIGDRVFHKGAKGNGVIVKINDSFTRDKYGIKFFWKKYKKMELHTLGGFLRHKRGVWASEDKIIKTPKPITKLNNVRIIGNRSLDKLIRNICEIPDRPFGENSDILINYGTYARTPTNSFTINKNLLSNKYKQCVKMFLGDVNIPETELEPFDNCIQKPFHSMGGKNIKEFSDYDLRYGYFQKKINKRREFRAHVFMWGDKKVPLIQEKTIDDTSQLTWNKKQGGKFSIIYQSHLNRSNQDFRLTDSISEMAIKAVKSINYDMGGVDLALDENGKLWVFEVNSRMGLREYSFETYKQMFWELYNLDINEYKTERGF